MPGTTRPGIVLTLTLSQLSAHVDHALGGGAPVTPGTQVQIINEAGRQLVLAHRWKFLERPPVYLSFTAAQEYINLPSDLWQVESAAGLWTQIWGFALTSFQAIATMRQSTIVPPAMYFGAVVHPGQSSATTSPPVPRLELYPTPPTSISNVLLMFYRAGWTEMSGASDIANIPLYAESLLIALCRAVAQGYEEDAVADVSSRVQHVLDGPLFKRTVDADGAIQPTVGMIANGALSQVWTPEYMAYPVSLSAPSP